MLEPGHFCHVYNRGNNRENLFPEARNYPYFLQLWAKYLYPVVETYAYALLPNHFHTVLRLREQPLKTGGPVYAPARAFAICFSTYAKAINKSYGRTGSLFQEHPKQKRIEGDQYLSNAICYTHTNALGHGLVGHFLDHPHHSFRSILSAGPTKLERRWVLDFFGDAESFQRAHRLYIENKFPEEGLLED